ncbi:CAP domain-containing protein [Solirubrobacter phytolaccae]|uniref:CAP domain-containing protein n=1 Tax=Solirubrobacter phytolaccae TaxID=1404360 RepID=A0A9X3N997_9ACTN|nr:CAP domain-containing protein [Solirubrobacter phytolaccae]MDA0180622.1 CAP domain-containing protein [Solirubrobacter phytolaccae]
MTTARPGVAGFALSAVLLLLSAAPSQAACAGADATGGSADAREAAMGCLVAETRAAAGRPALRAAGTLTRSAAIKAASVDRCGTFTHTPCGQSMAAPMRRSGYARGCFSVGENLAWTSRGATPRDVLQTWLESPPHRETLLDARYRDTGVARRVVTLKGTGRVELWVQHFGRRC